MKALIVEDQKVAQTILACLLKPYGQFDTADDGEQGLQKFCQAFQGENPYDVIFLDIMMPKLDGQALLSQIRDIEQENNVSPRDGVKVVMTTALDDAENVLHSHVEGCSAYLTKPIDIDLFRQVMQSLGFFRSQQ